MHSSLISRSIVSHENEANFDLCLVHPYREIKDLTFCPLFDDEQKKTFQQSLPCPSKFTRTIITSIDDRDATCCQGAIVSLVKPHRILSVSTDFMLAFQLHCDQLRGRSISALFGPRTDVGLLNAAIKNTSHLCATEVKTVLYTSTGVEVALTAMLRPYCNASDGSLGGCLLQIVSIQTEDEGTVFLVEDLGAPSAPPAQRAGERRLQREARRATGRDNEAERRRQEGRCLGGQDAAAAGGGGPSARDARGGRVQS